MKAKIGSVKQMLLPAAGIAAGMFASPKVASLHPTLAKYPELSPLILLFVALLLVGTRKAKGFAVALGGVALVFLAIALYNRVKGKVVTAGAPPTNGEKADWYETPVGKRPYPGYEWPPVTGVF